MKQHLIFLKRYLNKLNKKKYVKTEKGFHSFTLLMFLASRNLVIYKLFTKIKNFIK